jgi:hypothetical protein
MQLEPQMVADERSYAPSAAGSFHGLSSPPVEQLWKPYQIRQGEEGPIRLLDRATES